MHRQSQGKPRVLLLWGVGGIGLIGRELGPAGVLDRFCGDYFQSVTIRPVPLCAEVLQWSRVSVGSSQAASNALEVFAASFQPCLISAPMVSTTVNQLRSSF
jgi:hypothetical protein